MTSFEIIQINDLSAAQKNSLISEVQQIFQTAFDGVSLESIKQKFYNAELDPYLAVMCDDTGKMLGCMLGQRFRFEFNNKVRVLHNGAIGILPEYRQQSTNHFRAFYRAYMYREQINNPDEVHYSFGTILNPMLFKLMLDYSDEAWPHPSKVTPEPVKRFLKEGAKIIYGVEPVPGQNDCFLINRRISSRGVPDKYAKQVDNEPLFNFYLTANPDYKNGMGLLFTFPLSSKNLAKTLKYYKGKGINFMDMLTENNPYFRERVIEFLQHKSIEDDLNQQEHYLPKARL